MSDSMKELAEVKETTAEGYDVPAEVDDDESLVIKFKKPFTFERVVYTELDLTGLEDLSAADMIAVNKYMARTSQGLDIMPEVTLEYALNLAAKAAKMPIEFFMALPPKEALKVKNRVMGFLFGVE